MSGKRKKFKCGHRGFGQTCHRCEAAEKAEKAGNKDEAARLRAVPGSKPTAPVNLDGVSPTPDPLTGWQVS